MELCLFSVGYAGLWGQQRLDLPAFFARAAEAGYDAVMLMGKRPHFSPLDQNPESIDTLASELKKHNLRCPVIGAYVDLAAAVAAEVPVLEMQIAYVESLAELGAKLGANVVRVFTGYESEGQNPHAVWMKVVSALQEICDRAGRFGITIAVQNHHDVAVESDVLLELLQDIDRPNCKLGFDAWSPALRGEDLYGAALKMARHVAITTNADYVRLPRFRYQPAAVNYTAVEPDMVRAVPFGEGFIDYPAFFKGLKDGGFRGIATYEMCSPIRGGGSLENLDRYARRYVEWMRQHGLA